MNTLKLFAAGMVLAALTSIRAFAGTIDFENMSDDYLFYGGQQNFGTYWDGVYFGPQSTILDSVRFGYNNGGYPPHSGTSVLFSISTPYIDMVLDNAVNDVSFWYSANDAFTVSAYDAGDNLITSLNLVNNYGSNSFVDVTSLAMDIKRIRWAGVGNYFTIDDVSAEFVSGKPRGVPDSAESVALLGFGLVMLVGLRRRVAFLG